MKLGASKHQTPDPAPPTTSQFKTAIILNSGSFEISGDGFMAVEKRGRILSRRMISFGEGATFKDGQRRYAKKYEGKLQPLDGGAPIPFSTVYRVAVGDMVKFSGTTRATKLRSMRTLTSDK